MLLVVTNPQEIINLVLFYFVFQLVVLSFVHEKLIMILI